MNKTLIEAHTNTAILEEILREYLVWLLVNTRANCTVKIGLPIPGKTQMKLSVYKMLYTESFIWVFPGIGKPIFTVQLALVFTSSHTKYSRNISSNIAVFVCASISVLFMHFTDVQVGNQSTLCMGYNAINI